MSTFRRKTLLCLLVLMGVLIYFTWDKMQVFGPTDPLSLPARSPPGNPLHSGQVSRRRGPPASNTSGQGQTLRSSRAKSGKMEVESTVPPRFWKSAAAEGMPGVVIVESDGGGELEVVKPQGQNGTSGAGHRPQVQTQTSDGWPVFSKEYFPGPIPRSPFRTDTTIKWDFNISAFLQRPDVRNQPPKLITWMVPPRYLPRLPEPVRLRVCPEMPCRMATRSVDNGRTSSALVWAAQIMREPIPPRRVHPDQVFVFHNNEPQKHDWIHMPSFRKPAWKSAFNWTMDNRFDSDLLSLFGYVAKRSKPAVSRNYTDIVRKKTGLVAWMVSHCQTEGRREQYVHQLKQYLDIDVYGECSQTNHCSRSQDDSCLEMISEKYKFYLAFENAFCKDYVSEKFFRYLGTDAIVVARGSNEYQNHAPPSIFINTADFKSPKELANHLLYLDHHPEEYIRLLKAKDEYWSVTEDWPIRTGQGQVAYMEYHFESVSICELCRRLWQLDKYRKTVSDIVQWFDKGNCYKPSDL